jgi:Tfp pilus assembly protein PilW
MKARTKHHTGKNGFSLVELMLATVCAAILFLTVALILFTTYRSWRTNNEYVRLRRDAALAVRMMSRDIRPAALGDVTDGQNILTIGTNAVRTDVASYQRNGTNGILTLYIDGTEQGPVAILRDFSSSKTNEGVLLYLELANEDGDIVITNKTFIHVRN